MYPSTHFLVPLFIGEILVQIGMLTHTQALIAAVLAVAIDLDHYLVYALYHKDLNFMHFWNDSNRKGDEKGRTVIHHLPGVIAVSVLIIILFFVNVPACIIIALAYYSHILLDNCYTRRYDKNKFIVNIFGVYFKLNRTEMIANVLLLIAIIVLLLF
ncbi:MAG: metal-dependent hydrolase [Nanoarchaeota archaeon]|nr:metal-dependent hydrolase [Nanoarchaeota archaeon]